MDGFTGVMMRSKEGRKERGGGEGMEKRKRKENIILFFTVLQPCWSLGLMQ
jgi:hypothetical protein